MTRAGHARADPPTATAEPIRRPTQRAASPGLQTLTPDSILALQHSAGNRAVCRRLQRRVTGNVLEGSVGIQFAEQLEPDEMRQQVALVVNALDAQKLDPTTRRMLEQNLEELEEYASGKQLELPASTGYHLRQVIRALASDIRLMATEAKGLKPEGPFGDRGDTDLNWSILWLERVSDAIVEAGGKVASGEKGGSASAGEFAAAAKLVTGAIPMSKAIAAHMAYLKVVRQVEKAYPHSWSSMMFTKLEVVRDAFTPLMGTIWSGDSSRFDKAVAELLYTVPGFSWDFSVFVEDLEEKMKKRNRFLQWVGIFELALLAWDIWMLPVTGRPGGGPRKPPTIGGGSSGGAAVAGGGVLVAAESVEALRRLVRLGVLTNPGLVTAVSGGAAGGPLATPRPMHTEPPKGSAPTPDPNKRPGPGQPSASEEALVREYTTGVKDLREKLTAYEAAQRRDPNGADAATKRARETYERARKRLDDLEEKAMKQGEEAVDHLDPLSTAREDLQRVGTANNPFGMKVKAECVTRAPNNLRNMDFTEIVKALGRDPDFVDPAYKPPGAGAATAHQRLIWRFEDKSMLIVDKPGPPAAGLERPVTAELPHVELHGPKGERLDQQGIVVPPKSISAHMTITDRNPTHGMEKYFAPARAKLKK